MTKWPTACLGEVCSVNPRLSRSERPDDDTPVSFVPMAAVDEIAGAIVDAQVRPYRSVAKGYTTFREGDVLFAKITPCMENGKAAIAGRLVGGLGFGSTEFHVLRPHPQLDRDFLFHWIRRPEFRRQAKAHFTGTAGQQRVPTTFLENFVLPVPPLEEQRRIVDILDRAASIRRLRRQAQETAHKIVPALFNKMFGDPGSNPMGWPEKTLGQACKLFGGTTLPLGIPYQGQQGGTLLLKVGDLNAANNRVYVSEAREWTSGDLVGEQVCPPGTVVFPKRGAAIATNKKRLTQRKAALDPNMMGVAAKEGILMPEVLLGWFEQMDLADIQSGTTVPQLNKKDRNCSPPPK